MMLRTVGTLTNTKGMATRQLVSSNIFNLWTSLLPSSKSSLLVALRSPVSNQMVCIHTAHLLSSSNQDRMVVLPPLMDFPRITWPRFFLSLQNFVYSYIIRTYMDEEFDLREFDRGARQAMSMVSKKLASGDVDDLEGFVESNTLAEVKQKLSTFSVSQRQLLSAEVKDIFFSFPYTIKVILPDPDPPFPRSLDVHPDNRPPQTRHVEITVVFHTVRGFMEKSTDSENFPFRQFVTSEERNNVMVCNYRFFRDFTKGVQNPTWIINMMNHFLPADKS